MTSRCCRRRTAWIVIVACLLGPRGATGSDEMAREQIEQSMPDVEWDAVFSRTEGWTGGDVAGTIDLDSCEYPCVECCHGDLRFRVKPFRCDHYGGAITPGRANGT